MLFVLLQGLEVLVLSTYRINDGGGRTSQRRLFIYTYLELTCFGSVAHSLRVHRRFKNWILLVFAGVDLLGSAYVQFLGSSLGWFSFYVLGVPIIIQRFRQVLTFLRLREQIRTVRSSVSALLRTNFDTGGLSSRQFRISISPLGFAFARPRLPEELLFILLFDSFVLVLLPLRIGHHVLQLFFGTSSLDKGLAAGVAQIHVHLRVPIATVARRLLRVATDSVFSAGKWRD